MKTLNELYAEVMADENLQNEYIQAAESSKTEGFLKAHGCEATLEEFDEFMKDAERISGELSDDELENVAAGKKCMTIYKEGRPVVTVLNDCQQFMCGKCNHPDGYFEIGVCANCGTPAWCVNCRFCKYEGGLWLCYNDKRKNN